MQTPLWLKWKLLVTTLPLVGVVHAVNFVCDHVFDFHGIMPFSDVYWLLTGGAFLIGFMLAGTMADYKESEKLPGEMAAIMEAIEDAVNHVSLVKGMDPGEHRRALRQTILDIVNWMYGKCPQGRVFDSISEVARTMRHLDKAGSAQIANRSLAEVHNLRRCVTRVGVISRTGFLASGYALLEAVVLSMLALMPLSEFKSAGAEYTLISFVSLVYIYMVRLIRDLDDPFGFGGHGRASVADVDFLPLLEYRDRAVPRLETPPPADPAH